MPAVGRQRQADICEFEASLVVYKVSSWTARATQRKFVSKQQQQNKAKPKPNSKPNRIAAIYFQL